jgi:PAS domain S-box-containing protein
MITFKQYDKAAAKYYNKLEINTLPLVSANFYFDFSKEINNSFKDLVRLNFISKSNNWDSHDWDFESRINEEVIVVTDSRLRIVYASSNIIKMNGYQESEVLGESPKMFHGEATCQKTSDEIRESIRLQQPFEKSVLNYKKNGENYQCLIKGYPVFDTKGKLTHFIAFEKAA